MKPSINCLLMGVLALIRINEAEYSCYNKFPGLYLRSRIMAADGTGFKYGTIHDTINDSDEYESPEWEAYDLCTLDKDCMGFRCSKITDRTQCDLCKYIPNTEALIPGDDGFDDYLNSAAIAKDDTWTYMKVPGCIVNPGLETAGSLLSLEAVQKEKMCTFRQSCYIHFTVKDEEGNAVEVDSATICKIDSREGKKGERIRCGRKRIYKNGVYTRKIGGPRVINTKYGSGEWILVIYDGTQNEELISDSVKATIVDS